MAGRTITVALGAIASVAVALVLGATPSAGAGGARVAVGDYESAPSIPAGQSYSVGVFTVEKSGGKRRIVRGDDFAGIYYPDAGECDSFDLPLAIESIPLTPLGTFRHSEKTPVEDTSVKVTWKGRWSKPGVVGGSVTIKYDGCSSTHKWTGGKVG